MSRLSYLVILFDDARRAAILYDLLLPYAREDVGSALKRRRFACRDGDR